MVSIPATGSQARIRTAAPMPSPSLEMLMHQLAP